MTILKTEHAWRIVAYGGELIPVRVREGAEIQPGQSQTRLGHAPFSPLVVRFDGDGEWEPNPITIDFLARGLGGLDRFGAQNAEVQLRAALQDAVGFYGAGPYEGYYLPLVGASPLPETLENPGGERILPYDLYPASVKKNQLYRGWEYPILDSIGAQDAATAFYANESTAGAPILTMDAATRWSAPLPFAKATQGTLFVGHLFQSVGAYNLLSLGLPSEGIYSQALQYDTGSYIAHAGTGQITVLQDDIGGFGYLVVWAMTFTENGLLRLYSHSPEGFQAHGSSLVGEILPLGTPRMYLGSTPNSGIVGQIMPGATQFRAPAFTHRVMEESEIREALGRWRTHLTRWEGYTTPPPPYSLTLTLNGPDEIVAGRTSSLELTVVRGGGFLGAIEWVYESDDPSIRMGTPEKQEDEEGGGGEVENWTIPLAFEETTEIREHTLSVTVRAQGQPTSEVLGDVIDTQLHTVTVNATEAGIAEGAVSAHSIYDPKLYSFTTMATPLVGTAQWTLAGLARYSVRGDGIHCDGTNISGYGPSIATLDDGVLMSAAFTRTIPIADADTAPVGTVFWSIASKTVKNNWASVYKSDAGLRLRFSDATGVRETQALPITGNVMQPAVRRDDTLGRLELVNSVTGQAQFDTIPNWSTAGAGLVTAGGRKLSDGTVEGLSRVTILGHASHQSAVSDVKLERQAALFETYMLRTAQWERAELAPGCTYYFEVKSGETYRNRHPKTATLLPNLITASAPLQRVSTFKTDGLDDLVRTDWMPLQMQNPHDMVCAIKDIKQGLAGASRARITMAGSGDLALYSRFSWENGKLLTKTFSPNNTVGDIFGTKTIPDAGTFPYGFRFRAGRFELTDISGGETLTFAPGDTSGITGDILYTFGGTARSKSAGGGVINTQFFSETEVEGVAIYARALSAEEYARDGANLATNWDYSAAPIGGVGGVTPPPPPPPPVEGNVAALSVFALPSYSSTIYSGQAKTASDKMDAARAKTLSAYTLGGGNVRIKKEWNGTTAQMQNNAAEYAATGQYNVERQLGLTLDTLCFAWRAQKNPAWLPIIRDAALHFLLQYDYRGWVDTTSHARDLGKSQVLGSIYGTLNDFKFCGIRMILESGCGLAGTMHAAWVLWANRDLDPSYATTSHKLRGMYRLHTSKMYDEYYAGRGTLYEADGVTRKTPERVRRLFMHADSGDWVALTYWALIETSMYAAGVTAPVSIFMEGDDYPAGQYGSMFKKDVTQSLSLHSSTSASVTTHTGWTGAILAVQRSFASESWKLMAPTTFKDTNKRTYYPDGAMVHMQGNSGAGTHSSKFAQPTTYLNETDPHLYSLYLEGILTAAKGSQANADLFMRQCAGARAVGPWADTATTGKVRRCSLGNLGTAGTEYNTAVPGINPPATYNNYGDLNASTREPKFLWITHDNSGYLEQCMNKLIADDPTEEHLGAYISKLTDHIYRYGRPS